MKETIKINQTTQATIIYLMNAIETAQAQIQAIGKAYLDAMGETSDGWMLEKDFSAFVKEIPEEEKGE